MVKSGKEGGLGRKGLRWLHVLKKFQPDQWRLLEPKSFNRGSPCLEGRGLPQWPCQAEFPIHGKRGPKKHGDRVKAQHGAFL